MAYFQGKTIWIISPQRWGTMRVSKHHYASVLASLGNRVYFINPPSLDAAGIEVRSSGEANLDIVSYKPVFRGRRFLPSFIYHSLLRKQINKLAQRLGGYPDVVWCFQHEIFLNLNWFKAPVKIFHLVDLGREDIVPHEARTASFNLAVSADIAATLKASNRPVHIINHGLNQSFENMARQIISSGPGSGRKISSAIKVGHIGNLLSEVLDKKMMKEIICRHPHVEFIFWGSYKKDETDNLGGYYYPEVFAFIEFLQRAPNVILKGAVSPHKMAEEIAEADMFWICWKIGISKIWDGSNSHKILEYLSTGKPVVSHFVSSYAGKDLLYMLPVINNEKFPELFEWVLKMLPVAEEPGIIHRRIAYALDNTYQKQVGRIEDIIEQTVLRAN